MAEKLAAKIGSGSGAAHAKIYAFHISGSESSPSNAVTYMADAVGMTPAGMNYGTSEFSYGSWEDAFFMPRPCMVKYDGTVDYYLDPDDYSKKADGTASDIADASYGGNAMMEWGQNGKKIWYKIVPDVGDATSATVYISDRQVDIDYVAWSFLNNQGDYVDHFYTAIYNGSYDSNNKIRSLSGKKAKQSLTGSAEITACELNNPSTDKLWYTDVYCDRVLINLLLILMGKSLDTQTVFGQGLTSGDQTALNNYNTGALNDKGLFFGYSGTTNAVKVFGMENWWGAQWRRTAGLNMNGGVIKYKMNYPYSEGSTGYVNTGVTPGGTSGGYISRMRFNKEAMYAGTVSGGSTTYFCDGQWWNTSDNRWSLYGGSSNNGATCGAFCCYLANPLSDSYWSIGCALSLKPLA